MPNIKWNHEENAVDTGAMLGMSPIKCSYKAQKMMIESLCLLSGFCVKVGSSYKPFKDVYTAHA